MTATCKQSLQVQAKITSMLIDGYGFEDIAIALGKSSATIRAKVNHMRTTGKLAPIIAERLQRQTNSLTTG